MVVVVVVEVVVVEVTRRCFSSNDSLVWSCYRSLQLPVGPCSVPEATRPQAHPRTLPSTHPTTAAVSPPFASPKSATLGILFICLVHVLNFVFYGLNISFVMILCIIWHFFVCFSCSLPCAGFFCPESEAGAQTRTESPRLRAPTPRRLPSCASSGPG